MDNLLVRFAFWLHSSTRYNKIKKFFHTIMEDKNSKLKKYVDYFLIFLIIFSVVELTYSIKHQTNPIIHYIDFYIVSIIFALEYILRFWVYSDIHKDIIDNYEKTKFLKAKFSTIDALLYAFHKKIEYIKSPVAIIDFIAIIPMYRELRILRIFKLFRYTKSINQFVNVLIAKRFELATLFMLLMFLIVTSAIAIYAFEGNINKNINSLFDALYWALVTSSTVGYGDISPITTQGRVLAMVLIVGGVLVVTFATSVIVSAFYEKLTEIKEDRIVDNINKHRSFVIICGYGQMAKMLLRQDDFNGKYIILEKDPEVTKQIAKEGFNVITEDASRRDVLARFDSTYAEISVLCLGKNDVENIYITLNAKSLSKNIKVIARASDTSMEKKLQLAGANHVIMPNKIANVMLLAAINQPVMYGVMHSILTGQNAAYLDEIIVHEYDSLNNKTIEELNMKENKLLLIGIKRDGDFIFNPQPNIRLHSNDIVLMMGLKISIEYFKNRYQGI
ncbi:MAG: potassium channel protein [Sulfurovum sp. AS07-7]|nr:MAG: potassium channel protein [Sulfurovum sp. AS07-7]